MNNLESLLSLSHFRFSYLLFQGLNEINRRVSLSNKMDANQRKGKGELSIKLTGLLLVAEFHNSGAINTNSQVKQHQKALFVMSSRVY